MSELQTRFIDDTYVEYYNTGMHELAQIYLKSEADKVIAEKDEEIDELKESIDKLQKATDSAWSKVNAMYDELHRHKYKLFKANAEACMHKRWRTDEGFDFARSTRHMNKWLELAEKFKEAK